MSIVTRFPPSPTGFMHIGNARTALFNWLYARHTGGKFLVRIEDTDRARHSEEAVAVIFDSLNWMGLNFDNTPVSQFANKDRHIEVAHQMVERGQAYYCYCTPEELDAMREKAKEDGLPTYYDRRWRDKDPSYAPADIKPVIRIKAPLEGDSTVDDLVQGPVTVNNVQLDDMIILRSDGTPTYMLAVVVDDHDMGVTHVIRGDDHLNNTFRQNVIYDAMGWDKPVYAHMPMILGPDGAKLSKRHGAQSVGDLRDMGFLSEAVCNYLMRLGWSHGDDEIISMEQAVEWFDINDVNKSAGRFDFDKLESINAHYMKEADNRRLINLLSDFTDGPISAAAEERLGKAMDELKGRSSTLIMLAADAAFYLKDAPFTPDEKAQKLLDAEGAQEALTALAGLFETIEPFTAEAIEQHCRDLAGAQFGGKLGKVMMPLRAALTGTDKSPSLFHAAEILGRAETLARIRSVL